VQMGSDRAKQCDIRVRAVTLQRGSHGKNWRTCAGVAAVATSILAAATERKPAGQPKRSSRPLETDGKLDRNWVKGALGDAIRALLCGADHKQHGDHATL
jgi:hypothetical protein